MIQRNPPESEACMPITGKSQRFESRSLGVTIMGLLLIVGCEEFGRTPASPPASLTKRPPAKLYLSPKLFIDSFLLTDDQTHRWRFTDSAFVVESLGKPLPEALCNQLLSEPSDDYRIEGEWQLNATRDQLVLSKISTDLGSPRESVEIPIAAEGSDHVQLGGIDYRYSAALPLREVLPDRVYTAHVVEFQQGDQIRVKDEDGEIKDLRLFGIACPKPGQPYGATAVDFGYEKTKGAEIYVKVFDVDADGREIAQVWVAHLRYLNMELLDAGLAWHDKRTDDEWILATAEDEARQQSQGLWSDEQPIPPWRWFEETSTER